MRRVLVIALLASAAAFADPGLVAGFPKTATQASGTSAQTAASFSVASTDFLVVCGGTFGTGITVSSVGGAGGTVTWTQLVTQTNAGMVTIWKGVPSAGITGLDVKVTWTGTADGAIAVYDYSAGTISCGVAPSHCAIASAGTGAATVNVTNTAAGSRMVGCAMQGTDNTTWAVLSGFTKDLEYIPVGGDSYLSESSNADVAGGTIAVGTSSPTGKQWALTAVEVQATGGAAAASPKRSLMGVGQ